MIAAGSRCARTDGTTTWRPPFPETVQCLRMLRDKCFGRVTNPVNGSPRHQLNALAGLRLRLALSLDGLLIGPAGGQHVSPVVPP